MDVITHPAIKFFLLCNFHLSLKFVIPLSDKVVRHAHKRCDSDLLEQLTTALLRTEIRANIAQTSHADEPSRPTTKRSGKIARPRTFANATKRSRIHLSHLGLQAWSNNGKHLRKIHPHSHPQTSKNILPNQLLHEPHDVLRILKALISHFHLLSRLPVTINGLLPPINSEATIRAREKLFGGSTCPSHVDQPIYHIFALLSSTAWLNLA